MTYKTKIPVSVIILSLNEEAKIGACLGGLKRFDQVIVVDSHSVDKTVQIVQEHGAEVIPFQWDKGYPKKKQWAIDHAPLKHDFVFLVDADEIILPALVDEIAELDWRASGYFIRSKYLMGGKPLHFGSQNKKLCLFNRHHLHFPVVDDLGEHDLGEVEGHYQPVFKTSLTSSFRMLSAAKLKIAESIGELLAALFSGSPLFQFASANGGDDGEGKLKTLKNTYLHDALDDLAAWEAKHQRYARWEAEMNRRNAWPVDPNPLRQSLKALFRALPCRGLIAFAHSYIWKLGFLDGARGFKFAILRYQYYKMID